MSLHKRIGCLTVMLAFFSVLILSFPIPVSAAPAWTGAWKLIEAANGPGNPFGIAADQAGNVYVTDEDEIKKLPKGSTEWLTITKNGLSATPDGIAVDKNGGLYITDSSKSVVQHLYSDLDSGDIEWRNIGGHHTIDVWIPGYWTYLGGKNIWVPGRWEKGSANSGGIYFPYGVAVDADLNAYIANPGNINYSEYYNSLAMLKEGEWSILGASYGGKVPCYIQDVATDNSGNVYVTTQHSSGTNIGQDSVIKLSGGVWSTIERTYTNDPKNPGGIVVDDSGHIYVVSEGDRTVKVYSEGQWTSISGSGIGGPQYPKRIAVDGAGNIYVTDHINDLVWKLQAPATQLAWMEQPTDGVAGRTLASPPKVALKDAKGNIETDVNNYTVTLNINNGNGAALSGATATLQNGIATFDNLTVNKAGSGYTLTPSCSLSPDLTAEESDAFDMAAPALPQVTGISPSKGIGGTAVTITGTNLTAASLVKFGEVPGVNPVVESDTSVKVTAPAQGAGVVNVTVTTPGGESAVNSPADQFTYDQPGVWSGAWTQIADGLADAQGIAIDNSDSIYVVVNSQDSTNGKLMKLSGSSWSNPVSGLNKPKGVAVDLSGNTYVADTGNNRIMKNGGVMDSWSDKSPSGVAVDKSDNVYVSLKTNSGGEVHKWDGTLWSDITYDGDFTNPMDAAVDSYGNVYVTDYKYDIDNYYNSIVKKLPFGSEYWEIIGSGFSYPCGITVDALDNVYVADDRSIKELRVGRTEWRGVGESFTYTYDVALDSQGNLYMTAKNHSGSGSALYKLNAPATQLVWDTQPGDSPAGQTIMPYPKLSLKDAKGRIIENNSTDTVTLSLYSDNGATLEGTTTVKMFNGTADFVDLKVNKPGSGYILVPSCSLGDIAAFDSEAFDVSNTAAPTPSLAWAGGWTTIGSPAYGFSDSSSIYGITVDDDLNVYAVDRNAGKIRKFDGEIWDDVLTVPDYSYYGIALYDDDIYTAGLTKYNILKNGSEFVNFNSPDWGYLSPYDVAADKLGNIYTVGNGDEKTIKVLKYEDNTWSGIEYHESFSFPKGITVDDSGNVYVADSYNKDIKMLPAGTKQWKTIGTGFNSPEGIAVDNSGNVYVADVGAVGAIKVLIAGSSQWTSIPTAGTNGVNDVAVDKLGNVYATYNKYVYKHQAPAAKLVWETQPGGGLGNTVWSQQPVVTLTDAGGNIQTGDSSSTVTVTLSPSNGATLNGTADSTTVTLNQGVATFSGLKVDKPGTYTLTLSNSLSNESIECPESDPFDITVGPVNPGKSTVIAGKTEVLADNSDSAAVTVTLKDEYGNPVSGKTVELTQVSGSSVISTADNITDGGGNVIFWVKSTKAETVTYTAKDITDDLIITETAQISFKAGAADAGKSEVEAGKTVVTADGADSASIIVTLLDAYDNPVEGKTVTLSQVEGSSDISPASGVSGADGKVDFTVKNTKAEIITYRAETEDVILNQTVQLTFKAGPAEEFIVDTSGTQWAGTPFDVTVTVKDQFGNTVTDYTGTVSFSTDNGNSPSGWAPVLLEDYSFTLDDAGIITFNNGVILYNASVSALTVVDRDDSSITGKKEGITVNAGTADNWMTTAASTASAVTANGSDSSTITVTVKDSYGNPISGKTVTMEQGSGSSVITTVHGTSQADGTAVFTAKSTKAETVVYTVKVDGTTLDVTAAIDFIPGPADKLNITSVGTQTAGIPFDVTVTVWDSYENIVTGYTGTIQLTSTDAKAVLPGSHDFIEADKGVYTYSGIILKTAGVQTVTATDTSYGSITGTTEDINVAVGSEYAAKSTVAVGRSVVTADGVDNTTITVTLRDDYDNLISGKPVTLSQRGGSSVVETVNGATLTDGTAVFTVTNTKAEQVTYTAKVNGAALNQTAEVTFIPGPAETLEISASGAQAVGIPFDMTVTVRDQWGNTVTDYSGTVQLSSTDKKAVLPEGHTFTPANKGVFKFEGIILKTAGTHSLNVVDADNGSISGTTGNITVSADSNYSRLSTITANKSAVTADGLDNAIITVTLKDSYENLISGEIVALSKDGGNSVVESVYGTSQSNGTAVFKITNTKAEISNYWAMVDGKAVTEAVEVTFVPGAAARLEWKIQPGGGSGGQVWPQQPVLVLKDSYGNVNTGDSSSVVTVELKKSNEDILQGTNSVTLKNGEAVFNDLRIAKKGSYKLSPTIDMEDIDCPDSNTFRISLVPAPYIDPMGGTFLNSVTVSIDYSEEYEAYYNLDGEDPTQNSTFYKGPFSLFSNSTVTAAVYDTVYGDWSSITAADFIIRLETPDNDDDDDDDDEKEAPPVRMPAPDKLVPVPETDAAGKVTVTVSAKLDISTGTASAEIDSVTLANAFNASKAGEDGTETVSLVIPKVNGAMAYEFTLPASFLDSGDPAKAAEIGSDIATVTILGNMLSTENSGTAQNVSLRIAAADKTKLDESVQAQIGDRPVIELSLKLDGQQVSWSNESAPVTVSVAYTPTAEELMDPENITVWYIDGSGNVISVPSGRYDPSTGRVTFITTHFSKYAVAFVRRTFTDLSSHSWARNPIEVLASKGIIDSTEGESFYPAESITRADYLMMLVRTLGLSADFNENFDDIKTENVYYKEIGAARKLGITSGIGGNKFNPAAPISRQDMMVLTERALSSLKKIRQKGSPAELERFADKDAIAAYAASSMASLVGEGLIKGSGGKINPLSHTTRAEAAVFLYRIYNMK